MRLLFMWLLLFFFSERSYSQCEPMFSMTVNADTVRFISQATTTQGTIVSWHWNFGDGSTSLIPNPVHVYSAPGAYMIQHSVQTNLGNCTDVFTMMVIIAPSFYYENLCPPAASTTLYAGTAQSSYQWQVSTDSVYYSNLTAGPYYSGVQSQHLNLINIPSSFTGYRYRCVRDALPGTPYQLLFGNQWLGTQDNSWGNAANWSCGTLPDENTDVVISAGNVLVNVNTTIRSLTVQSPATVTVQPGVLFTILH